MTFTFNSRTLKNTQIEPQKDIIIFQRNKWYLELMNKILKKSTFQKITVGGFVNQLIKKSGLMLQNRKFSLRIFKAYVLIRKYMVINVLM